LSRNIRPMGGKLSCCFLFAMFLTSAVALAQSPAAKKLVEQGVQAYMEGEYEKARELLDRALTLPLDIILQQGALQYLASSLVALGQEAEAEIAFNRLLDLSPQIELPAGTPPKILRLFEAVKERWHQQHPPPVIEHQPPQVAQGESVALECRVENLRESEKVIAVLRQVMDEKPNQATLTRQPDGSFRVVVPGSVDGQAAELNYYFEVRAADNTLRARLPTSEFFRLSLAGAQQPPAKAKNSYWWVWAAAAVVLGGTAAGLAVWLSGPKEHTGRAIVVINVP